MNKEEILNTFLLANIPEIITQEEFNDVKKAIKQLQQENKELKEDLKTLWIALWNNDTEMTSYQSEIFDKYYDQFHKKGE